MNWVRELCDLYDKNKDLAGIMQKGRYGENLVLLPVFHTTVTAQITVSIDVNGNFLGAETVPDEDKLTLIPVTEKSASRTAGIEAHPLCDNLKYAAGDYMIYVKSEKGKDFSEHHEKYISGLQDWSESAFTHEKVRAICAYIEKNCLMKDLIACGCIQTDENGAVLENAKIQNIKQTDAFIRFRVEKDWKPEESLLADTSGKLFAECWRDLSLAASYISYSRNQNREMDISYLSGEWAQISYLHPKKIRNEGDGAKLISANDETGFTFKGRFVTKEQAFSIGYEDSQKAHNALKWIIRKQGKNWNGLSVVTWESDLNELPDWTVDTDTVCDAYESEDIWGEEETEAYEGTNEKEAIRFQRAIAGYRSRLNPSSKMILLAFDAATTGRLAMVECQSLLSGSYLANLLKWYESCGWIQPKFKNKQFRPYYGVPGIRDIAELLYGTEQNDMIGLKGSSERMYQEVVKRLIPCIILGKKIPEDMVRAAVHKASSPVSYHNRYNWERVLALACSLIKKKRMENQDKEEWTVALKEDCTDRNYLFGRLLAAADRIEYRTFDKDEIRETNAKRYMNRFSQQPFRTWKIIEERLCSYYPKLKNGERLSYEHLIEDIIWKFEDGDFEKDGALSGLYLLGFHNQAYAFRNRQEEKETESETGEKEA